MSRKRKNPDEDEVPVDTGQYHGPELYIGDGGLYEDDVDYVPPGRTHPIRHLKDLDDLKRYAKQVYNHENVTIYYGAHGELLSHYNDTLTERALVAAVRFYLTEYDQQDIYAIKNEVKEAFSAIYESYGNTPFSASFKGWFVRFNYLHTSYNSHVLVPIAIGYDEDLHDVDPTNKMWQIINQFSDALTKILDKYDPVEPAVKRLGQIRTDLDVDAAYARYDLTKTEPTELLGNISSVLKKHGYSEAYGTLYWRFEDATITTPLIVGDYPLPPNLPPEIALKVIREYIAKLLNVSIADLTVENEYEETLIGYHTAEDTGITTIWFPVGRLSRYNGMVNFLPSLKEIPKFLGEYAESRLLDVDEDEDEDLPPAKEPEEEDRFTTKIKELLKENPGDVLLFCYGSNHPNQLSKRLNKKIKKEDIVPAYIKNYERVFRGFSMYWHGGVATLIKRRGATTYGYAIIMTPDEMNLLDHFEGARYKRTQVKIVANGIEAIATAYISDVQEFNEPSKQYLMAVAETISTGWKNSDGGMVTWKDIPIR